MNSYSVHFTNVNTTPISIDEQSVDNTSTDLTLFGYIRLRYGEKLQENLVSLLENFACEEDPLNPGNPYLDLSVGNKFENPIEGQFWYNKTTGSLMAYDGTEWLPIRSMDDIAANWGSIGHGFQIPKPVSPTTGYEFDYSECIWSVSPSGYGSNFNVMNCTTDADAVVTAEYGMAPDLVPGIANYLIIGIRGNKNRGTLIPPPQVSGITPTPTPTFGATPTPTATVTATPDLTPTVTPTISLTPEITPTITPTPSPLPLGVDTRLYTAPSPGDPGIPGPGGTGIRLYNTCGPLITINQVQQTYALSLQDISGGNAPYRVSFYNVVISPITGWYSRTGEYGAFQYALPPMTMELTYAGGNGSSTNPERTGLLEGVIPKMYMTPKFNDPSDFRPDYTYLINYRISGYVMLIDSTGQNIKWYVPRFPSPVGGTNERTFTDWELEIDYGHYELCEQCPDCL